MALLRASVLLNLLLESADSRLSFHSQALFGDWTGPTREEVWKHGEDSVRRRSWKWQRLGVEVDVVGSTRLSLGWQAGELTKRLCHGRRASSWLS